MATDARGHTVPAATDVPSRNTLLNLALSVNDFIVTASGATRTTLATALAPTTSRPLVVYRTDARADSSVEITSDGGTTWQSVPWSTGKQNYTPVLGADTTAPTLGIGGVTSGLYVRNGQSCVGHGLIYAGTSGTAVGNGFYNINLPIAVDGGFSAGGIVGTGTYFDSSATTWYTFELRCISATTARMQYAATTNTALNNTTPGWNINDKIDYNLNYIVV